MRSFCDPRSEIFANAEGERSTPLGKRLRLGKERADAMRAAGRSQSEIQAAANPRRQGDNFIQRALSATPKGRGSLFGGTPR